MKRTYGGIQFTYTKDGYLRLGDGLPHWVSPDGIKLFCGAALQGPLSNHWEIVAPDGKRTSGIGPVDALMNAGLLARE